MKILIVEDEPLIATSLQKLLLKRGHHVTTTSSGKEAIEIIFSQDFDRIVCDLMLQDITGFDVIEESKKKFSIEQIKQIFVIMTAYSSDNVIARTKEYDCYVLRKPFDDLDVALNTIDSER